MAIFLLTACQEKKAEVIENPEVKKATDVVELKLDQTALEIKAWNIDNSHMTPIQGKLLVNGEPVVHATIQSNQRTIETDDIGTFNLLLDQSVISKTSISVKSLDQATMAGKPIADDVKAKLMSQKAEIQVYYPIKITKVEPATNNPEHVSVHAQAVVPASKDSSFPAIEVDKYAIYGLVKDHAGNPVENAIVNIRRDGVEGFAKSDSSNKNGEYILYYLPEEDEIYLNVHVGDKTYTFPQDKVIFFPEETSIKMDITLPKEGNVLQDYPPYLVR